MVCCYILHSRHLLEPDKALEFYSQTRTNDKKVSIYLFLLHFYRNQILHQQRYDICKCRRQLPMKISMVVLVPSCGNKWYFMILVFYFCYIICVQLVLVIIRLEAMLRGEYWNYFRTQFGGVRAFGCNSTDSEPIWMKSGALLSTLLGRLLARFLLFFCPQNNARFTDFSSDKFLRHLNTTSLIGVAM